MSKLILNVFLIFLINIIITEEVESNDVKKMKPFSSTNTKLRAPEYLLATKSKVYDCLKSKGAKPFLDLIIAKSYAVDETDWFKKRIYLANLKPIVAKSRSYQDGTAFYVVYRIKWLNKRSKWVHKECKNYAYFNSEDEFIHILKDCDFIHPME